MSDDRIDHDEQIGRMFAVYDRFITETIEDRFTLAEHAELTYVRSLVRQAIEQAWDAGHACHRQNKA